MSKTNVFPLHTNKAIAIQKQKRQRLSVKSQKAIDSGNIQSIIDSLSETQKRFCEEFLIDLNGSKAVARAGYTTSHPGKLASQIMQNPAVRITIDALKVERAKGMADVTKDYVLQGIQDAIDLAKEGKNLNALLRGYELLARHLGMFIERTEISGPDGEAIAIKKMEEDIADFTSSIASLSKRSGTSG